MDRDDPVKVLIAGGGVAALEAALTLRALAEDRIEVELLAPEPHFWYRPLAVAQPFRQGEVRRFELSRLASAAGATFTPGALVSVDATRHLAYSTPGGALPYTALLIACGAEPKPAIEGALTFRGPADTARIEHLLAEIMAGDVRRVVFAIPPGAAWSLPAYELALMTAAWVSARGITGVELGLVTPEERPLHVFGRTASDAVAELLDERGIAVYTRACPAEARDGELLLVADGIVVADRVVALPRLQGPRIGGIPQTFEGFIAVDEHGRISGTPDVYAAGDITSFPVKQGGIAAQQAGAAAEAIAASAGLELTPHPFRPVLRGLLLTGDEARYLRHDPAADEGDASSVSLEPLWWPPAKIAGRHLAPFLASLEGADVAHEVPAGLGGMAIEIELEAEEVEKAVGSRRERVIAAVEDGLRDAGAPRVAEVMSAELLVVAPEDTLGEVAEKMGNLDVGSAIVAEYGRLTGILTSRDLLRAVAGRVHSSEARVRQWMTAEPVAVSSETTIEAARMLMAHYHIHHLPVVEGDRPVGVVALRDVANGTGS